MIAEPKLEIRYCVLWVTTAFMLCSGIAATSDDGRPATASVSAASMKVSLTARRLGSARFRVMNEGATLHAGDEVRIDMTAEDESYAYIFHRGASGEWALLFPAPDQSGDINAENPLLPGEVCSVPGENSRLVLNGVSGIEELVVYVLPHPDQIVSDLAVRLRHGEHLRIQIDQIPPDAVPSTGPRQRLPVAPHEEVGDAVVLAMRDLTFVSPTASGEARLPANYAAHFTFRNEGKAPNRQAR